MAVVDQHALAAHLHGVRWATLATSVMELTHPLAVLPAVAAQVVGTHSPPPAPAAADRLESIVGMTQPG